MKFNLRYKRFIALMLMNAIWILIGPILGNWEMFKYMIIPVLSLNGTYIVGDSWRASE